MYFLYYCQSICNAAYTYTTLDQSKHAIPTIFSLSAITFYSVLFCFRHKPGTLHILRSRTSVSLQAVRRFLSTRKEDNTLKGQIFGVVKRLRTYFLTH